jgi:Stage II sporulation protein E (SpoIIE)
MPRRDKWKGQVGYWKSLSTSVTAILLGGVFFLFAPMGLMAGIMGVDRITVGQALVQAGVAGGFSVGYAFAGFRRIIWLFFVLIPLQFATSFAVGSIWGQRAALPVSAAGHAALLARLRAEAVLTIVTIVVGYILFVIFIRKEGLRVFGPMTEVRLANELHRALVPAFSRQIGDYEICGSSVPTGQVGGDLVDLIEAHGRWTAYVGDVSGHGVPAGMMMAMVKSAARMASLDSKPLSTTLGELNQVFSSLSASNVFVTFACIAGGNGPDLTFALAGHLPILHYHKREGQVEERSVSNLPLAVLPDAEFATASLICEPGDVLAILTDGLTETADDQEQELGLEPLKAAFLESAGAPLEEITKRLRATSLERGPQGDDQTVLLVRRSPEAGADSATA